MLEQQERDREQREKELREEIEKKERLQFEQKMREQREQEIREQREREAREQKEREEREQRERLQFEQKMREQSEREARERDEFERRLRAQEEKERLERIEREKLLREREEREKEQRDKERELARLEFEKNIREQREREEKERKEREPSDVQTALSALTTFIIPGNQESNKKLLQIQDEITTTATTNQIYHIDSQEHQELINQVTLEPNNEMIMTDYNATYVQEEDSIQYDTSSQISDEEEQRKLIAGNYINSLIDNVRNELLIEKNKNDESFVLSSYKAKPLSDDLLHLIDSTSFNKNDHNDETNMYYKRKVYIFEKEEHSIESDYKQPSLAQIIQSLNKGLDLSLSESSEGNSMQESYAPPFSIGIRLRQKLNALEIGNHVISYVEPDSLADKANLKKNSRLLSINETTCDDRTHEFVVFFLNYVLRKKSCSKITLCVEEPVELNQIANKQQINYINESYRIENANLRAIIKNILTGEEFTPVSYGPLENLKNIVREAKQVTSNESEYHDLDTMVSRPAVSAVDSSGIENLKSIIRQIKYSFEQHVEHDEELETHIHIKQPANSLENLKNILQQAIDRNEFYLDNSQILLQRGIF